MKTKEAIKEKAMSLFNSRGLMNITLRDVAAVLYKSYGNITYHYPTKEDLLDELYIDMVDELKVVGAKIINADNLFQSILEAPANTFDLSIKHLFFFKDYVEIKRNFPAIAKKADTSNEARKKGLKQTLVALQVQGIISNEIDGPGLEYLMELSGAMRTFFFLNLTEKELKDKDLKSRYIVSVNQLLFPYLSTKGKALYRKYSGAE